MRMDLWGREQLGPLWAPKSRGPLRAPYPIHMHDSVVRGPYLSCKLRGFSSGYYHGDGLLLLTDCCCLMSDLSGIFLIRRLLLSKFFISKPPIYIYRDAFSTLNLTLPCHSSSFLSFVSFCLTLFAFGPLQLPTHSLGSPQLLQNWINRGSQELSSVCYSTLLVLLFFFDVALFYYFHFYSFLSPPRFLIFSFLFFSIWCALKYPKVEPLATNLKFLINKCWIYVIIIDG